MHYPPRFGSYQCREILEMLPAYGVKQCFYGHLHGDSHKLAFQGNHGGVEYRLVAADYLDFCPLRVL